jgi:hypothetical protein
MNLKGCGRGLILKCYTGLFLEGLKITTTNLGQNIQCSGRNLNRSSPQYKSGAFALAVSLSIKVVAILNIPLVTRFKSKDLKVDVYVTPDVINI